MDSKLFLFIVLMISFFTTISAQQPGLEEKKIYYDTIKLLQPKPDKEDKAVPKDYLHSISIQKNVYEVVLGKKKYSGSGIPKLELFIKNNRKDVIKQTLNIIVYPEFSYDQVVDVLDIMTKQHIQDYRVLSVDGIYPQQPPIVVPTTKPPLKTIDLMDSSVFIISFINDTLKTSFLNKTARHESTSLLDQFISANKMHIDPAKVVVIGEEDSKYADIAPILELLLKYEYFNYRIIVNNPEQH